MAFRGSPSRTILFSALLALAPFCAPARADEPSPAALALANRIIADLGLKASVDLIVPVLFGDFEKNVVAGRPELKDPLHQILVSLAPEFSKGEPGVLADVAHVMATKMTEPELKEVAAFYESPTGQKFVQSEPAFVAELQVSGRTWRQKLTNDLLTRVREELKKKGIDF